MILVIIIDVLVLGALIFATLTKGFEKTLPVFAFCAILIPSNSTIPIPGLFGLTTQRLAVIALIALYIAFGRNRPAAKSGETTPLLYLLLIHVLWCIISTINSINPMISLKQLFSAVFEYYVVYYIFFRTISSVETIKSVTRAMVYALAATTLFGSVEAYTGWSVLSWFPVSLDRFAGGLDLERGIRVTTTFPHPILYGGAIAVVLPLALYVIATSESKIRKVVLWLFVMLMFLCLYKTASRGPWVAAMIGVALMVLLTARTVRKYVLVIAVLCAIVLVARPGIRDTIMGYYDATYNPDTPMGSSYEYRYALLNVSTHALAKNVGRSLWGYGMESFYYLKLSGPFMGTPDHLFESCDSAWIQAMVETGYVGFVIFVLILGNALFLAARGVRRLQVPDKYLQWIFLCNLLQCYFMMLSVALYGWGQNGYMLWIIIAMSLCYENVLLAQKAPVEQLAVNLNPVRFAEKLSSARNRHNDPRLADPSAY